MMKILFLGQNPSRVSPDTAFYNTKSMNVLQSWISRAGITGDIHFANVFDDHTMKKFPKKLITERILSGKIGVDFKDYDIIYLCGVIALKAMDIYLKGDWRNTNTVYLPHPSGLNRKLNDAKYIESKIEEMRKTYESTIAKTRKRIVQGSDSANRASLDDVLSGKASSVCPVVKDYQKRYNNC